MGNKTVRTWHPDPPKIGVFVRIINVVLFLIFILIRFCSKIAGGLFSGGLDNKIITKKLEDRLF